MYRDVLPGLALGTPRLYGYRWEPGRGELWLFIEDVGPHRLAHRGELALFERAAAWLGRFHSATTGAPSDERLLRHDRAHFWSRGRDLEACLKRIAVSDRPLVERALARHDSLVQLVDGLPHGMIHGEFFGKNVLLRNDQSNHAVAVIDWETAATGPRYVDLASISAGRWTPSQRMAMRRAYFAARYAAASACPDWRRFNQEVDIVAFLQAVSWLGFWVGSDPEDPRYASHVAAWLRELRTTMVDLDASA
jgi:aminoglycoside phosphotransferase (APT) family kinase protein